MHIGQGSSVTTIVVRSRRQPASSNDDRSASSSAWAVGSPRSSRRFRPFARIVPSSPTRTAPTGTSPASAAASASAIARPIKSSSVHVRMTGFQ